MKEIEVQTENEKKEIIKSSKINIDDDDRIKVIVTIGDPAKNKFGTATPDMILTMHEYIVKAFQEGNIITIPDFVKINTIKI